MKNQFGNDVIAISYIRNSNGGDSSEKLFEIKDKRKKSRRNLRFADKFVRRLIRATADGANELADRHERSSRKKRSGGLRDIGKNMFKASRKASKRLRLFSI